MAFTPPALLRGVFAGAGVAMMGEPAVVNAVLGLAGKPAAEVRLLYLGTASYDLEAPRTKQLAGFEAAGVTVCSLDVARRLPSPADAADAIAAADVLLVSGGNTQFAVDRWRRAQLFEPLRAAMERGATLCGGSAGAGCWFDGLHSDSMDPQTYRDVMLSGGGGGNEGPAAAPAAGGGGAADEPAPWEYIRVSGLGFLPGLVCPHHDQTQSNGLLRSSDFDGMLRRHACETGIGIDHYAALVVADGGYSVLSLPGQPGSLMPDGTSRPGHGAPAAWLKTVGRDGVAIDARALPEAGPLSHLLAPAVEIVEDPRVAVARAENPSDE